MPIFVPRDTPDYSRLAALYQQGGDTMARLSLQRGQATAATLDRLGALFSGFHEFQQQRKVAAAATALRQQERTDDRAFQSGQSALDRTERAAERKAAKDERDDAKKTATLTREEEQLEGTLNRSGGVQPVLYELAKKFPALASRFQVQDGAPVLMNPDLAAASAARKDRASDNDRMRDALDETKRHNQALEKRESATGNTPVVVQTPDGPAVLDRKTLTAQPITMAGKTVGPAPSAAERMDSRKFSKAAPVLKGIGELSERINTLQGVYAKAAGEAAKAKAKVNLDDDVAEYQSIVSMFTPMVARALGHTGVLTEQDVQSVKEGFPKPGDSKTLRDRKMARLLSIIGELEGTEGVVKDPNAPQAGDIEYDMNGKPIKKGGK